jgi:hypothetical protein
MEGKDDNKYLTLMAKYKEIRGSRGEKAVRLLNAAARLRDKGNVSDDAVIGGGYL